MTTMNKLIQVYQNKKKRIFKGTTEESLAKLKLLTNENVSEEVFQFFRECMAVKETQMGMPYAWI